MLDVEYNRRDVAELERAYDNLLAFPRRDFMEGLVDTVLLQTIDRFDTKRDPSGAPWKPWSDSYRRAGAPFHVGHTLLVRTGDLQNSIAGEAASGKRGAVTANVPYAGFVNDEREFLGFVDDDPHLEDFFLDYMEREVA